TFIGGINKVNGRLIKKLKNKNKLIIGKKNKEINIEGWMYKEGINNLRSKKILALKQGNDFIYISGKQLKDRKAYALIKKYGKDYRKSGYRFNINKSSLKEGEYKIYYLIESKDGEFFVQDAWKWLIVK